MILTIDYTYIFLLWAYKNIIYIFKSGNVYNMTFFDVDSDTHWFRRQLYLVYVSKTNFFDFIDKEYTITTFLLITGCCLNVDYNSYMSSYFNCYRFILDYNFFMFNFYFNFNNLNYIEDDFICWYRRGKKKQSYFNIRFAKNKRDSGWYWLYR